MNLKSLNTEQRNPNSMHIDEMDTTNILKTINTEDHTIPDIVEGCIPQIQKLVDEAYKHLEQGGRLFYIGAGTSGRLGSLDASECPPTYGVSPELVQGLMAGGNEAIYSSLIDDEDNEEAGMQDLKKQQLTHKDIVIGIAASGRTPYVVGGLKYANEIGALTGSISCVKDSTIATIANCPIQAITGPEVITGSSRMKAGTAQKLILNMISTTLMIKYGKVYENLMIDVQPTNEKLVNRATRIIQTILECTEQEAIDLLNQSDNDVKLAVTMGKTKQSIDVCKEALKNNQNNTKKAIKQLLQ